MADELLIRKAELSRRYLTAEDDRIVATRSRQQALRRLDDDLRDAVDRGVKSLRQAHDVQQERWDQQIQENGRCIPKRSS